MSGGVESIPSNVFVEAGYHGVKLPAKLWRLTMHITLLNIMLCLR